MIQASQLLQRELGGEFPKALSDAWKVARNSIITATNGAAILNQTPYSSGYDLLMSKLKPRDISNDATRWGNKFEPIAKSFYERFKNEKVYSVGLVPHAKYKWLGATPDGLMLSGKLLEIKCPITRPITNQIPLYYKIQMQLQMEVCNIDVCDYIECEFYEYKDKKEYDADIHIEGLRGITDGIHWKINKYFIYTVYRDRAWFNTHLGEFLSFYTTLQYYKSLSNGTEKLEQDSRTTNNPHLINWKRWVSATSTRNYLIDDPLLDWLKMYKKNSKDNSLSFRNKLFENGNAFESQIFGQLRQRYTIVHISTYECVRSHAKYLETIHHIRNQTPIIYQAVLHDFETKTYGTPDLLIRSDILSHMMGIAPIKAQLYTYRVVEIKDSILQFKADGIHIRASSKNVNAYKGQLYVYTKTLGAMQGYTPSKAYIIGNRWVHGKTSGHGLTRLGCVDFNTHDRHIRKKTARAIKWVRDLRFNGHKWSVSPPSRDELKPNMCNTSDEPWHDIKKKLARRHNDITELWMCRPYNRVIAEKNGITNWRTQHVNAEDLGIKGDKIKSTLQLIMEYNSRLPEFEGKNVYPDKIKCNKFSWKKSNRLEFFVDFESISDVMCRHNQVQWKGSLIFMIGIGWYFNNKWLFKSLCVNNVLLHEEKRILCDMHKHIKSVSESYKETFGMDYKPNIYHWGAAEQTMYKHSVSRHKMSPILSGQLCDFLKVMKEEPVVVRGSLNFSVKSIGTAMYKLGLIETTWDKSGVADGLNAMVYAYEESKKNTNFRSSDIVRDIADYNEVDCKVVGEIIRFLRG